MYSFKEIRSLKFYINKILDYEDFQNLIIEIKNQINIESCKYRFNKNCLTLEFKQQVKQVDINKIKKDINKVFQEYGFIKEQ